MAIGCRVVASFAIALSVLISLPVSHYARFRSTYSVSGDGKGDRIASVYDAPFVWYAIAAVVAFYVLATLAGVR